MEYNFCDQSAKEIKYIWDIHFKLFKQQKHDKYAMQACINALKLKADTCKESKKVLEQIKRQIERAKCGLI